ncbi:MAG: hypothetical protein EPO10_23670 [Reyranella sp.]|uniref:hypothetical protein n=1 Tax=Reyranella sp. TaxID=1929291 RepID=UPI001223A8A4|nr:hypothetical protein [Reyranella sp.]TAJ92905.1 MAG: hypothetical protein EPO41_13430 [Reyranella sp.]TBR25848.1 MAG: hypothetical protein EPO10_23670 [Reyranella sp.]
MTSKTSEPSGIVVTAGMIRAGLEVVKSWPSLADGEVLAMAYRAMAAAAPPESLALSMPTPTMLQALRMLGHK